MTEIPDRVERAFRDHDGFDRRSDGTYAATTTPFEGSVSVTGVEDGRVGYEVTVRVPMLSAVVEGDVADVVEDGWYETFELRVEDVGGVTRRERDLSPSVRREADDAAVTFAFEDVDERRGVDDAEALVNYVAGTYVQGIIPGYDYTEPVASLISRARQTADG